jgi:hypothetical protein
MVPLAPSLLRILLPSLIVLVGIPGATRAADPIDQRLARLAAAYVFNFIKFIDWPAGASGGEVEVCFSGADDIRTALSEAVRDKPVGERRIKVRTQNGNLTDCDVLYVDSTSTLKLSAQDLQGMLTIGDASEFTREGGVIRLYVESNRLRFAINMDHAKRAKLQVSSNLLKLASGIEQEQ